MRNDPFVVVVDDDPSVRRALKRLLGSAKIAVETYASGEDFLPSLTQREPDCVVLDIRMPGMTGLELRDRVVAMGRRIPIVFITAHAEDAPALDATGSIAEFLRKPFEGEALLDAIARAILRHRTQ